jgi:hypothetical protein
MMVFAVAAWAGACAPAEEEDDEGAASGSPTPTHGVSCSTFGSGCRCTNGSTANDFECSPSAFPDTRCCADTGWPNQAGCECQRPPSNCKSDGLDYAVCGCAEGWDGSPSDCTGNVCCEKNSTCYCYNDRDTCGGEGWTQVTSCAGANYDAGCPVGKAEVATCSTGDQGAQASSSSSGGGF